MWRHLLKAPSENQLLCTIICETATCWFSTSWAVPDSYLTSCMFYPPTSKKEEVQVVCFFCVGLCYSMSPPIVYQFWRLFHVCIENNPKLVPHTFYSLGVATSPVKHIIWLIYQLTLCLNRMRICSIVRFCGLCMSNKLIFFLNHSQWVLGY